MFSRALDKYQSMPLPAKAGVWFTLCSIIQRGISVISMPIFTRLLSTDAYGTYSLYTSWYMLFSLIVTLNLASEVFNKGLADMPKNVQITQRARRLSSPSWSPRFLPCI